VTVTVAPATRLRGVVRTPGDKSISHRAVLISALADGTSTVTGCSDGGDVKGTIRIVRQLGAHVEATDAELTIAGPRDGLRPSNDALDCGNSGTTMRLLCGVLASAPGRHRLVGDASLTQRPMDRVAEPLAQMGLAVTGGGPRVMPPLLVTRTPGALRALVYTTPVASAQVKSALIFAALQGDGVSTISERTRTRANTEEMLRRAGVTVTVTDEGDGRVVAVHPGRPRARSWRVPGDPSQAAFFVVAALTHPDADIEIVDVYGGPERNGYLAVLERMGGDLRVEGTDGTISVTARSTELRATTIFSHEIPSVDEVPVLAVAAAAAVGTTRFVDVGELRVKESDRFREVLEMMRQIGVPARGEGDDLLIEGVGSASKFRPLAYDGDLDHRMVMAAAVAGVVGHGARLANDEAVASSYPGFFQDLAALQ
jgi:3-phosphoshikimate 1-carboxyvinyltransferase